MKFSLLIAVGLFAFALINVSISTTALSQSKRQLDDRVPAHVPIKIKIKKEHEECFQHLDNEYWPHEFVLEVTNTGERPIYGLSLVWQLTEVKAPDGNTYGSTFRYGRMFPGQSPKPDDVPLQSGETHVFKLSKPTAEGLESFAKEIPVTLKTVMVWLNFICFGEGMCLEGPEGKDLGRKKPPA